jgi:hypothetical protein
MTDYTPRAGSAADAKWRARRIVWQGVVVVARVVEPGPRFDTAAREKARKKGQELNAWVVALVLPRSRVWPYHRYG